MKGGKNALSLLYLLYGSLLISLVDSHSTKKSNTQETTDQSTMIIYKFGMIVFLFFLSFLFGLLPIKVSYFQNNFKLIGIANAFSGGIFLCVALLHLLPESTEIFNDYFEESSHEATSETNSLTRILHEAESDKEGHHHNRYFPVSFLLAFMGYTLILMLEKIIFDSHSHNLDDHESDDDEDELSDQVDDYNDYESKDNFSKEKSSPAKLNFSANNNSNITGKESSARPKKSLPVPIPQFKLNQIYASAMNSKNEDLSLNFGKQILTELNSKRGSFSVLSRGKRDKLNSYFENYKQDTDEKKEENFKNMFSNAGKISNILVNQKRKMSIASRKRSSILSSETSQTELLLSPIRLMKNPNNTLKKNSFLFTQNININNTVIEEEKSFESEREKKEGVTSILLLLALSIHACFEGIAIGLQGNPTEIFYMFLAISFHKWVEALSIGINLNNSNLDRSYLLKFIVMFSLTTPLGMVLGMIFSGTNQLIEATFLAISAGSFMYISASEIVIEEFSVSKFKKEKFLALLFGAFIICVLTMMEHH